jgi:glucosamine 6-phosphate synthetase-like amidotransferase/phosphosugar isomerase protein
MAVVADAGKYDAATLTIGAAAELVVDAEIPSWMRPVLHLIPLQILALERAKAKGLNPDLPRNLVAVVELDRLGEVAHQ